MRSFVWNSAHRPPALGKLFWSDSAVHPVAIRGRSLLLHCQPARPNDDPRSETAAAAHLGYRIGHVGAWVGSQSSNAVCAIGRSRGVRAVLDINDGNTIWTARTLPRVQREKDKGLVADAGLFTYPVLMAADILAYDSNLVPVGQDQTQHIEVCRDLARAFNFEYGSEVFVLPQAKVLQDSAKVPGTDGEKMSKSYNNFVEVFESSAAMRKKVMRIATDSRPVEQAKEPDNDHLFQLYSLFVGPAEREAMAALYRSGGFGYGQVKQALADAAEGFFGPARERREAWAAKPDEVRQVLGDGATVARKKAGEVLRRAQAACGVRS